MIDDPEEEAWMDLQKRQEGAFGWRKNQIGQIKSVEDAFADWEHSHRPDQYSVELRAFKAGWVAAIRNEWLKERND